MKKARIVTFIALTIILSVFAFAGCSNKGDTITSVSLKGHDPSTAIEIALGEFDFGAYTLVVAYESGSTAEIALTEEMITEADLFKLYQIGDHDMTINYGEQKYTFKISVKKATFGELSFPENSVFTYDGKAHTVEVDGNIPANAVVTYLGGNSFVNAGTYDVAAVVSCEGYVTAKLTTTVKIERAKYDMSGVRLVGKEVVYDGSAHSLAISGTLPEGVSTPTYTIDGKAGASATDVGEYTVKATFVVNDPNYEAIPEMEATLKITPAEYVVKGVDIVFKNEGGNTIGDATKIYDGKSVTFDLNDYTKLSQRISVSFSVCDKDGNVISTSNQNTGMINAGIYTVKVNFTLADGKNYQPITPIVRSFEVLKAEHPALEDIKFTSAQTTYDGNEHSIVIEGQLPEGVTVSYEYYLNGDTPIVDANGDPVQSVSGVGAYVVKAVFTHGDPNLGKIADARATLTINKVVVDTATIGFFGEKNVAYSGQPYAPTLTTWKEVNGTDYDILQYGTKKYYVRDNDSGAYVYMGVTPPSALGAYRVEVDVSVKDEYRDTYTLQSDTLSRQFEIVPKTILINAGNISFADTELAYNGEGQRPVAVGMPEHVIAVAKIYTTGGTLVEEAINAGTYRMEVTLAPENANYTLSGQKIYSTEFEIKKQRIDLGAILVNGRTYTYDGSTNFVMKVFEDLDPEIKKLLDYSAYKVDGRSEPTDNWVDNGLVINRNNAYYCVFYTISIKEVYKNNFTLYYNGSEGYVKAATYEFYLD